MFDFDPRPPLLVHAARAALLLTVTGCESNLQVPQPPDLTPLVQLYDHPTGDIDFGNVSATLVTASFDLGFFNRSDVSARVAPLLDNLAARLTSNGILSGGNEDGQFQVDAAVEVTHRCADGIIRLTAVMLRNRVDPVAWGTAEQCHDDVVIGDGQTYPTYLDGKFALYLYDPALSGPSRFLFVLDGTLRVNDQAFVGSADFRVSPSQIDVRVAVPTGGDVIASLARNGVLQVHTAHAIYTCDVTARQCSSDDDQASISW